MTLTSLDIIKNMLLGLTNKAYHYHAPEKVSAPYIVWAEDSSVDFEADNHHGEFAFQGTIDLYTLDDEDPLFNGIVNGLNGTRAAWYLNSVQYEEETALIHYEWVFEV